MDAAIESNFPVRIFSTLDWSWQVTWKDELPDRSVPISVWKVEIFPGVFVKGFTLGKILYVYSEDTPNFYGRTVEESDQFFQIEPIGVAYHKSITVDAQPVSRFWRATEKISQLDSYGGTYDYGNYASYGSPGRYINQIPYNYLRVRITFLGQVLETELKFHQPSSGDIEIHGNGVDYTKTVDFFGLKCVAQGNLRVYWRTFTEIYKICTIKQGSNFLLQSYFDAWVRPNYFPLGLEKRKKIKVVLDLLQEKEPLLFAFYQYLKHNKVVQGTSNNRLLSGLLKNCGEDFESLKYQLTIALKLSLLENFDSDFYSKAPETRALCLKLPYCAQIEAERRAKTEWNWQQGVKNQALALGIDPKYHSKLLQAIIENKISLNLFHVTGKPLNLINVEFDIWERALRRPGWAEVIFNICGAVTNKNRFEKHITPFLSFLFRLEKYLKRHTGKNWKAFPSLVNSEAQLEMAEKDQNNTVKTRSALTPIPDNEKNTITVPYAGLRMSGTQTTYCYSKLYQVFEADTIDLVNQSVISKDLEEKLNGRDDYGLMYYTLDGTLEAQGYPTFLIIFERRKDSTFVHFHRVHPCRTKNGIETPACRLIQECYRYMCGNITAQEITYQQGDMIFIKQEIPALDMTEGKGILEFESHCFAVAPGSPNVILFEKESKSVKNRLGFIYSAEPFVLTHPEHEHVQFDPGYYEVRRTKSFEANPSGIWSYTFD